ncbi:2'-5' RNA ligase family protein [Agromyces ramosus]|uniref:2'-5' RNA ligase n=1 Tax=Agromyces ramosus TaxID=33879 RepID=A0ABU0RE44_9MICO|nr:2'-5' RNA ligase family protein [Agromyces ramosus]MDQ0895329.1 2'-5' RNA ligase [Agromyces ramosus]
MARFVVVLPLVPLAAGDEFTVADWPLHVTLVEPFQTDLPAAAVADVVGRVSGDAQPVRASGGEEAMFGRRRDVPVTLVRERGALGLLRERALAALGEAGVDLGRVRPDFRPHVTRKHNRQLRPGEPIVLETVALVDMNPAAGSHHRSVVAAWRLGEASG